MSPPEDLWNGKTRFYFLATYTISFTPFVLDLAIIYLTGQYIEKNNIILYVSEIQRTIFFKHSTSFCFCRYLLVYSVALSYKKCIRERDGYILLSDNKIDSNISI